MIFNTFKNIPTKKLIEAEVENNLSKNDIYKKLNSSFIEKRELADILVNYPQTEHWNKFRKIIQAVAMLNYFFMCLFFAYTPTAVTGIYIICIAPWWLEQYTDLYRGFALSYVIGSTLAGLNIALLFYRDPNLLMIENKIGLIIFTFLIALNFIMYLKLYGFSRAAFRNVEWDNDKNYPKFD